VGEITSPIGGNAWTPDVAQFSAWMGRKIDVIGDYMNLEQTWDGIDGDGPSDLSADAGQIAANPGLMLELSVPMLPQDTYPLDPWSSSSVAATDASGLQEGATGAFNSYWEILGENLVADGLGNTIIRLGEESNGNWAPWSAYLDESAFAEYFDQVVTTMRAVPGSNFLFDFNGATGLLPNGDPAINSYPGDNYVNFIGGDYYDAGTQLSTMYTGDHELDWLASFAAAHGKLISIGEFGLVAAGDTGLGTPPGGDDPAFIQDMYNFAVNPADRLGMLVYFDENPDNANSAIFCGQDYGQTYCDDMFPNSVTTWLATFGKMPPGELPSGW